MRSTLRLLRTFLVARATRRLLLLLLSFTAAMVVVMAAAYDPAGVGGGR